MKNNVKIFFRKNSSNHDEYDVCSKYFDVHEYRSYIIPGSLVIPRYSALPFYKELEEDLKYNNSILINSYKQHKWIADFEYYDVLKYFTFKTWFDLRDLPENKSFVIKGKTNSRKLYWNDKMFARNIEEAANIYHELCRDDFISEQGIIFREYVPLVTYEIGINDLRFTNEWRFFFFRNKIIDYGYYWAIAENIPESVSVEAINFAEKIGNICSEYVNFFVLDIAQKEDGNWILVEINDGSMSGLSCIDPDSFYKKLHHILKYSD
jgi:hypothetical protein